MGKRLNDTEISAYLDGETNEAERIRLAIGENDGASELFHAYARLSERLKALPQPEVRASFARDVLEAVQTREAESVAIARLSGRIKAALPEPEIHPAFATRVVAAIESDQTQPAISWRLPLRTAALAAAAVLAFVIAFGQLTQPNVPATQQPLGVANVASIGADPADDVLNESTLLAEFDRRIASDTDMQRLMVSRYEASNPERLYDERLLTAFTANVDTPAAALRHNTDYRASLRHLDREQTSALKQLLEVSVQEAREG